MMEYEVTGITYQIGRGLDKEAAKQVAHEYIMSLPIGTPLILQAEPSNVHDENAIAVYADYSHRIGYIKRSLSLAVKPLLDEDGQCDAVVTGVVGSVTLTISIPNAPEVPIMVQNRSRVLPEHPYAEVVKMQFTEEELQQCVLAPRIIKLTPNEKNAAVLVGMAKSYLPIASLSICCEDEYWRDRILVQLRAFCRLDLDDDLKTQLVSLKNLFEDIEGDRIRTSERSKLNVMEQQLKALQSLAEESDGLYANFEAYINKNARSMKDEVERLEQWFLGMHDLRLQDWHDRQRMSEGLAYHRLSRKELYEVYASLLLLDKYSGAASSESKDSKKKKASAEKPQKPRETMTFSRKSSVSDGHLTLLYLKLVKEKWIEGIEGDFKALFSGKRDEACQLTWMGVYGKGTLVELFKMLVEAGLVTVPPKFTLPAILEGHFKDTDGKWLTGLAKGNSGNDKALPFILECINLLKADPRQIIGGNYDGEDEDFKSVYDPYDHQDMHIHMK